MMEKNQTINSEKMFDFKGIQSTFKDRDKFHKKYLSIKQWTDN